MSLATNPRPLPASTSATPLDCERSLARMPWRWTSSGEISPRSITSRAARWPSPSELMPLLPGAGSEVVDLAPVVEDEPAAVVGLGHLCPLRAVPELLLQL